MKKFSSLVLLIFGLAFLMPPQIFAAPDRDQGISFVTNIDHFIPAAVIAPEIGGVAIVQCLNVTPIQSATQLSSGEIYTAEFRLYTYNYSHTIVDLNDPPIKLSSGYSEITINRQKNYCSIQIRADSRLS